jgi:hypothetical protein
MTRLTISYDLAVRDIPHSADAATNGKRESVPHGDTTDPGVPMTALTPAPAGTSAPAAAKPLERCL